MQNLVAISSIAITIAFCVSFSICAIGDTAYDEFCKAGVDWNDKYKSLGANMVHEIQLCDVDYEPPWAVWVAEALPKIALCQFIRHFSN